MSQSLVKTGTDFPSLFHIVSNTPNLPMPFAREIFLLDCHVAGTTYRPDIAQVAEALESGAEFRLQREPQNEFDSSAIAVYDASTNHLGYIPRHKNEIPARLMDAGKRLSARLHAKEWTGAWLKLDIKIFLHD